MKIDILKTESHHKDFKKLVYELDLYLTEIDGEDHSFYAQYNQLSQINHCVILYLDGCTVSCGAFKFFENQTVEIKECTPKQNLEGVILQE